MRKIVGSSPARDMIIPEVLIRILKESGVDSSLSRELDSKLWVFSEVIENTRDEIVEIAGYAER